MSDNNIELFSLWTALDIEKSDHGAEMPTKAPIAGIVSTDSEDLQGDRILQEGCDWDYFLRRGWLNYEHQQGPEHIVGVPTSVKAAVTPSGQKATRIEGYLLLDRPRAKEVYEAAKAIQKATGSVDRSIGFSVEGQVMERDSKNPKIITRARILNVSVTAHPVNPDARLEVLARSLTELDQITSEMRPTSATLDATPLDREDPMSDLEQTKKGAVGYQEGSKPDAAAALSSLVPQSIDGQPSSAAGDDSGEDMSAMIEGMMRRVMKEEMSKMMADEVDRVINQAKGSYSEEADKSRAPMVSLPQMQTLLGKVFPQLPASEHRAMARRLLSAAKGYPQK